MSDGPDRGELVYFIAAGAWVKVGYTQDVNARMRSMQTGNPLELDRLMTINHPSREVAFKAEREWRDRLGACAIAQRGEWVLLKPLPVRPPEPIRFVSFAELIAGPLSTDAEILSGALASRGLHFDP